MDEVAVSIGGGGGARGSVGDDGSDLSELCSASTKESYTWGTGIGGGGGILGLA